MAEIKAKSFVGNPEYMEVGVRLKRRKRFVDESNTPDTVHFNLRD